MTPQERQMIDDLFDRLAKLEGAPRDPEAAAAIAQGLRNAPNAVYALVQTVLVQDEALKRANSRIQELEAAGAGEPQPSGGGFLDSMRETIFGQGQTRGSVPNVPPPAAPASRPVWNSGQVMQQAQSPGHYDPPPYGQPPYSQPPYGQPPYGQPYGAPQGPVGGGGSFLGTAAAAAAGTIGGSLLLGSIRSMMGGGHRGFGAPSAFGDTAGQNPVTDQSGSTLAQDAGIKDIGGSADRAGDASRAGLYDTASNDDAGSNEYDDDRDDTDIDSDDFGGDGDSDYA
jgi:hypothetical protein